MFHAVDKACKIDWRNALKVWRVKKQWPADKLWMGAGKVSEGFFHLFFYKLRKRTTAGIAYAV
jgi:hypothetical protein